MAQRYDQITGFSKRASLNKQHSIYLYVFLYIYIYILVYIYNVITLTFWCCFSFTSAQMGPNWHLLVYIGVESVVDWYGLHPRSQQIDVMFKIMINIFKNARFRKDAFCEQYFCMRFFWETLAYGTLHEQTSTTMSKTTFFSDFYISWISARYDPNTDMFLINHNHLFNAFYFYVFLGKAHILCIALSDRYDND